MKVVKFDDPYKRKNIETCEELYNIDNHYTYITNLFHQIDFSYLEMALIQMVYNLYQIL